MTRRIAPFNEEFFGEDTPESFYWAGFLAADGCVYRTSRGYKYLRFSLSKKDIKSVIALRDALDYAGKIGTSKKEDEYGVRYFASINIMSDKLFNDLSRFNIVPNKTSGYKMPNWVVNHRFISHFIRGYVDGDGSFYHKTPRKGRKVKQLGFCVVGTFDFIQQCAEIFSKSCNVRLKFPRKNKSVYAIEYVGNNITENIKKFLYKDASVFLERKKKIAFENIDRTRGNCKRVVGRSIADGSIIELTSTMESKCFGFLPTLVGKCCRGERKTHKGYSWKYIEG